MKFAIPALTAGFMLASQAASAEEIKSLDELGEDQKNIILQEDDLTIVHVTRKDADGKIIEDQTNINSVFVICATQRMADVFAPEGNVALAFHQPGEEMRESMQNLITTMEIVTPGFSDKNIPQYNFSIVDTKNNLIPAYSMNEILSLTEKFANGTISETGSPARDNPQLLGNIKKHVENYCNMAM